MVPPWIDALQGHCNMTVGASQARRTSQRPAACGTDRAATSLSSDNVLWHHHDVRDSWTRFYILCALGSGPQYPYRIAREVAAATGGLVVLEAGNLHRRLQQLLADGLIGEAAPPGPDEDRRRRYFAITRKGRLALRAETERMAEAMRVAKAALAGGRAR
jgi:DNA-binding PadR family transcriptional regulator